MADSQIEGNSEVIRYSLSFSQDEIDLLIHEIHGRIEGDKTYIQFHGETSFAETLRERQPIYQRILQKARNATRNVRRTKAKPAPGYRDGTHIGSDTEWFNSYRQIVGGAGNSD